MVDKNKIMESLSNNLPAEKEIQPPAIIEQDKDITDDYSYSREKYKGILNKGEEALDGMMQLAIESEHPRAYEVLSNMLKNMADVTDKLMELQKKKQSLVTDNNGNEKQPQSMTQNNVFLGSTSDLQRMIMDQKSEIIDSESNK
jgi:hypothetical protein